MAVTVDDGMRKLGVDLLWARMSAHDVLPKGGRAGRHSVAGKPKSGRSLSQTSGTSGGPRTTLHCAVRRGLAASASKQQRVATRPPPTPAPPPPPTQPSPPVLSQHISVY